MRTIQNQAQMSFIARPDHYPFYASTYHVALPCALAVVF
jgi:hypothetical protein